MIINRHTSPAPRRRITAAAVLVAANALVAGATLLSAAAATGSQSGTVPGRPVGNAEAARKQP